MAVAGKDYWDSRGRLSYRYKGERFYTVTAIPYYYRRRQLLTRLLGELIGGGEVKQICDFGCGDGWYLAHFAARHPQKRWYGLDMSEEMIARAREAGVDAQLRVSADGISGWSELDLVYAVAVFAHVLDDAQASALFGNIAASLRPGGRFAIFEQTAPRRMGADFWCRRTAREYEQLAADNGLQLERRVLVSFALHRWFERYLAPHFIRAFVRGETHAERCIKANANPLYRALSALAVLLSPRPVRADDGRTFGNTFLVFRKV